MQVSSSEPEEQQAESADLVSAESLLERPDVAVDVRFVEDLIQSQVEE
jgi:hypothetical protein